MSKAPPSDFALNEDMLMDVFVLFFKSLSGIYNLQIWQQPTTELCSQFRTL